MILHFGYMISKKVLYPPAVKKSIKLYEVKNGTRRNERKRISKSVYHKKWA